MGLVSIKIICQELIKHGLEKGTLSALVQQGTTQNQKVFTSTVEDMPKLVEKEKPKPPTIFIIGNVVHLRDKLNWFSAN